MEESDEMSEVESEIEEEVDTKKKGRKIITEDSLVTFT